MHIRFIDAFWWVLNNIISIIIILYVYRGVGVLDFPWCEPFPNCRGVNRDKEREGLMINRQYFCADEKR